MIKILIFGTGTGMEKIINFINKEKVNIEAFIDNNKLMKEIQLYNKKVIRPEEIKNYEYDYILVASGAYKEITEQLLTLEVKPNTIVQVYNYLPLFPDIFFYNDEIVKDDNIQEIFIDNYATRVYGW